MRNIRVGCPTVALIMLVLTTALVSGAITSSASSSSPSYKYTWKSSLSIAATGNVTLKADAFVPVPTSPTETFPVIIFPNSWGCPQIEYIVRALNLAERGYVALEYETRGWYTSGGEIDTAGPLDRQDGSIVIDFVAANAGSWKADMSRVAFMGISYGAGISLMMAGYDKRVTTALALSGWNNLTLMLYGNETPNRAMAEMLIESAQELGRIPANLPKMLSDLMRHESIPFLEHFGQDRSPQKFLDAINGRQVPLFLSSNYMDELFRPQYMQSFFGLLTGPKMLLLNQGGHAMPEGIGIFVHDNYIWSHAYLWLDHYLRNVSNGVDLEPMVQMQQGDTIYSPTYINYDNATKQTRTLYFQPRSTASTIAPMKPTPPVPAAVEAEIHFAHDVPLHGGDDTQMALGEPSMFDLVQPTNTTLVYLSEPFAAETQVCGAPTVDVQIATSSDDWQFYTFLYLVSPTNKTFGSLWSHGFYTHYRDGPTAGPAAERQADASWIVRGAQLHTICKVVPSGYSIALGMVLYDKRFQPANDLLDSKVRMHLNAVSALHLPIVQ